MDILDEVDNRYTEKENQKINELFYEYARAEGIVFTEDEVAMHRAKFQYLLDWWLDEYERKIFDGLTLKDILAGRAKTEQGQRDVEHFEPGK